MMDSGMALFSFAIHSADARVAARRGILNRVEFELTWRTAPTRRA
jgi:hypothetical protein